MNWVRKTEQQNTGMPARLILAGILTAGVLMACQACLSMGELNGRFLWIWAAAVLGRWAVGGSIRAESGFSGLVPPAAALSAVL